MFSASTFPLSITSIKGGISRALLARGRFRRVLRAEDLRATPGFDEDADRNTGIPWAIDERSFSSGRCCHQSSAIPLVDEPVQLKFVSGSGEPPGMPSSRQLQPPTDSQLPRRIHSRYSRVPRPQCPTAAASRCPLERMRARRRLAVPVGDAGQSAAPNSVRPRSPVNPAGDRLARHPACQRRQARLHSSGVTVTASVRSTVPRAADRRRRRSRTRTAPYTSSRRFRSTRGRSR